jgi:hypothetical protein
MDGLSISERYFFLQGAPIISTHFQELLPRIAAGLVGEGSECFRFDDQFSRDHDWGPAFCLWLEEKDFRDFGPKLRMALSKLPTEWEGMSVRSEAMALGDRVGVLPIGRFYRKFLGWNQPPTLPQEWLQIPEQALAACTNGRVFCDPLGTFSHFRMVLLAYYPEPVRLRKLEARCTGMAQSGQYNLLRSLRRGDEVAARLAETEFIRHAISATHLLARRYRPFYKWMHRNLLTLPGMGQVLHPLIRQLASQQGMTVDARTEAVEEICSLLICELQVQNLTQTRDGFLLAHAQELRAQIDPSLQDLDPGLD